VPSKQDRAWEKAHRAEIQYGIKLRKVARYIGDIVKEFASEREESLRNMQKALRAYSETLTPWAEVVARRMLWDVSRRNEQAWVELSKTMGRGIREEIASAPTGEALRLLMAEQVTLIKSLPLEAAQRVHELAINSIEYSSRGENIVKMIMASGEVSKSRATLIARTETSRATSVFTQVRATHIGSEGYIWRTSKDALVRPSHQKMEGRFVYWNQPPEVDPGKRYHAGCFPNCRCIAEPQIPDKFL
jgi:SPP1 gp7 family putative phage head morphogenesis protein